MKTILIITLFSSLASASVQTLPPTQTDLEAKAWQTQVACNQSVDKDLPLNDKLFEFLKCFNKGLDVMAQAKK